MYSETPFKVLNAHLDAKSDLHASLWKPFGDQGVKIGGLSAPFRVRFGARLLFINELLALTGVHFGHRQLTGSGHA